MQMVTWAVYLAVAPVFLPGPPLTGIGSSVQPFPSYFIDPTNVGPNNIWLGELIGVFTDSTGVIVGSPFAIGDGPLMLTDPLGATQIELGLNDDIYGLVNDVPDNTGALVVSVSAGFDIIDNAASRNPPALRLRPWRVRPAWLASEAEGRCSRSLIKTSHRISEGPPRLAVFLYVLLAASALVAIDVVDGAMSTFVRSYGWGQNPSSALHKANIRP